MYIYLILGSSVVLIAIVTVIVILVRKYKIKRMKDEIKKDIKGPKKEYKKKIKDEAIKEFDEEDRISSIK